MDKSLYLLYRLTKKDIALRYKGSALGVVWAVLHPILMLIIYTIVFSVVLGVRWDVDTDNRFAFAIVLFSGLNIVNMAIEVFNRSTTLISSHANYVKKVIFPLRILPLVITFSALFNCIMGFAILFAGQLILINHIPVQALLLPVVLGPFVLIVAGFSYIISGISVYVKDMVNFMGVVSALLMFTSPVFFPMAAMPDFFARISMVNPFTFIIENVRNVVFFGQSINWGYWFVSLATGLALSLGGYKVFGRLRKGFADVL
jgi:lipopolysaccharide transport system permease protein